MPGPEPRPPTARLYAIVRLAAWLAALVVLYGVAVCTPFGQWVDASAFGSVGVFSFVSPALLGVVVRDGGVAVLAVAAAILGGYALLQRRLRPVVVAVAAVAASGLVAEALKQFVLPRPYLGAFGYPYNTFPSGHTAVALSLMIAVAVLAPATHRWVWIAVASAVTAAVAWISVVTLAHRPSDVIAGALVVGAVASVVFWRREPALAAYRRVRLLLAVVFLACLVLVAVAAAAGGRTPWGGLSGFVCWPWLCVIPVVAVAGSVPADPVAGRARRSDGTRRHAG